MSNDLLLVACLGFAAGYLFKTILHGFKTFSLTANFVRKVSYQLIILLGNVVYKISYIDQVCAGILEKSGKAENAKVLRLKLEEDFEEWKQKVIEDFKEHYPPDYKWQLELDDWAGLMKELTSIYKEKKT